MEKKIKVFPDSNILFSIAYSGKAKSRSYLLFELQEKGIFNICVSPLVCEEASLNIKLKRPEQLNFLDELIGKSKLVENILVYEEHPGIKSLPQNDRIILLTAVYHRMDFFLTGNDRDFSKLYNRKVGRTLILKPADFLHMNFNL
jgi:predicted nucleic acid-binding protein